MGQWRKFSTEHKHEAVAMLDAPGTCSTTSGATKPDRSVRKPYQSLLCDQSTGNC